MSTPSFPPLLVRSPLLPGESLYSLLIRLAAKNYHELLTILKLGRLRPSDNPFYPRRPESYPALAGLTYLPVTQIYEATLHPFTPIITPKATATLQLPNGQAVPLLSRRFYLFPHLYDRKETPFCPHCLAETPHHKSAWMLRVVTACLPHHCLLLTGCPVCHRKLPVTTVVNTLCPNCNTDLRQAETKPLDELGQLTQQTIQSWFGLTAAPNVTLPNLSPPALYRLLTDITNFIQPAIRPATSHQAYTTTCKGLIDWPTGFYALLDTYRQRPPHLSSFSITNIFGALYRVGLKRDWRDFEPVQQAFEEYVVLYCPDIFSITKPRQFRTNNQLTFISWLEAERQLKTTRRMVEHLVSVGLIGHETKVSSTNSRLTLLRQADVLALQAGWNTVRNTTDLARLLVTDEAMVTALLARGLLAELTYAAAWEFLDGLQTSKPVFNRRAVPLSNMPDPLAALEAVLAGKVRMYFQDELGLNHIRLARHELIAAGLL